MTNHIFICYSTADAKDFALKLYNELKAGLPSVSVWLDKQDLIPGIEYDVQIEESIRTCAGLAFVMSIDSLAEGSECKTEWTFALRYKKPVIPLRFHSDIEMPFLLGTREYIDFSGDFGTGMTRLRQFIEWMSSPAGVLYSLKCRLADLKRSLRRAECPLEVRRIKDELEQLELEITAQQRIVDNPEETEKLVGERIQNSLKLEQEPKKPVRREPAAKLINQLPGIPPAYFQDRHVEMILIGNFLKDDAQRMMMVVGPAGIGKTTMVCRMLNSLKIGKLPDNGGDLPVDGIVCLGENSTRKINFHHLFTDLCSLLPTEKDMQMKRICTDPYTSTVDKMRILLSAFQECQVVVLLDNFETKLDVETLELEDEELKEALQMLLTCPHHGIKVIITTRVAPYNLIQVEQGRLFILKLDHGLESPFAENLLRGMDIDGKLGLKDAPDDLLAIARERTRGYPRALEVLVTILKEDWSTNLHDILTDTENLLPERVVEVLVGEAFSRLDARAQQVMQALAIYNRPVAPVAVDYLLQPFLPGVDSEPILKRLVNMHLVRKEEKRYYLHPIDREYALSRMIEGEKSDRDKVERPPFTRFALFHRGADYFKEIRMPRENWNYIDDLEPQWAEIDLRYAAQDFDTAARILLEIDFDCLFLWGHYRLMIDLHKRLQGKIVDLTLQGDSVGNLGSAYRSIGEYQKAISSYEKAVDIAREKKDSMRECVWTGNLGNPFFDLGEIERAIGYYKDALAIAQEKKIPREEAINYCRLGLCYAELGHMRAIMYYRHALDIYSQKENSDPSVEAITHGNLGICYAAHGDSDRAVEHYKKALSIAQRLGARDTAAVNLSNMGDAYIMQNRFDDAVYSYEQSILIADEIGYLNAQNESRCGLALAYLYSDDLEKTKVYVEDALKYDYPKNRHGVQTFFGLVMLRQGNIEKAKKAFRAAISEAQKLLRHTKENYKALDDIGLSRCGLALCHDNNDYIHEAKEAFQEARTINKGAGHAKRLLRFFDQLAKADKKGRLKNVREEMVNFTENLNKKGEE